MEHSSVTDAPSATTYLSLNSSLNLYDEHGKIQFDKDEQATKQYFLEEVNPNTVFFHNLEEKLHYLVKNNYYESEFLEQYDPAFVKRLFKRVYDHKFRFSTFVGAYKFYTSYALKTNDGQRYLERYEDRIAVCALYLAEGVEKRARDLADEMITQRYQPATPTFLNAGRAQRGELVSCDLIDIADDMNSIGRNINTALQLSKRGADVAFNLTNLRATTDPIKNIEGQASGVIPVMKLLENCFSYANQLGQRNGSGAVYLNVFHFDILTFLDSRREAADEKIRIKTLSLGVIIPDILFELAKNNEDMYMFSPYDVSRKYGVEFSAVNISEVYRELVDDPSIRKQKINARRFFQMLAEVQFESGYPYIMFEDTVNRANQIEGKIRMSNLCSEILQVSTPSVIEDGQEFSTLGTDISCNLGSMNIPNLMDVGDGRAFGHAVEVAIRALTTVSDLSDVSTAPSIQNGNNLMHAVGLGAMNLHGYMMREGIDYGDAESVELTDALFRTMRFHAMRASNKIARERETTFYGFERSGYADGSFFQPYIDEAWHPKSAKVRRLFKEIGIPDGEDWAKLAAEVKRTGLYHSVLMAIAPTGSISYLQSSSPSIGPINAIVESRKEGKIGRVYVPAPYLTDENANSYRDGFAIGYERLIDVYAAATKHIDQGISLTLFLHKDATTRDLNKAQIYAWKKGIKTIYYVRVQSDVLDGTDTEGCVACAV
jgi:ribonucleoside-diphosphate reductase alpha chain